MKKISLILIGISLALSAQAVEPKKVIGFRQGTFQVIAWNFGTLAAMAKGDIPYDKAQAEIHANRLVMATEMVKESFIPGTYVGESKTNPNIATKESIFNEHYTALLEATKLLASAAGDLSTLKPQVGKTGGTCKACHDDFKMD